MNSPLWSAAQRSIRATARRFAPYHLRQEIVEGAEDVLLDCLLRGHRVDNWVAYSAKVTRSLLQRGNRQRWIPLDEDSPAPAPRWSPEQPIEGSRLPDRHLRGAMQKRLVAAVLSGETCVGLSESLGIPEKEVRRQMLKLAATLWLHKKRDANFHREPLCRCDRSRKAPRSACESKASEEP